MLDIIKLRRLCSDGKIKWTSHIMMRMEKRGIEPSDVKSCIITGEIIEQYPTDYPFPSCLILGDVIRGKKAHIVIGLGGDHIWLITAYYPNPEEWSDDLRTRRNS